MRTAPKYITVSYTDSDGRYVTAAAAEMSPWWEMVDEPDFTHHYNVIEGVRIESLIADANAGALMEEKEREERFRKSREDCAKETADYWEHKRRGEEERIKYNELKKEIKNANS
jgi:hypothetical protein